MRLLWTLLVTAPLVFVSCGGHSTNSGGEFKPRPLISSPCWALNVQLAENGRLPEGSPDSLGFTTRESKYSESDEFTKYTDNLRHRLAEKYGLVFADNCFEHATIDVTLFVSNMKVSFDEEYDPTAERSNRPNDPAEGTLSRLHKPPASKKVTRSFDDIMKIELKFESATGATVDQLTIIEKTSAKSIADTIAVRLSLPKK
jgi:hypothetical protein